MTADRLSNLEADARGAMAEACRTLAARGLLQGASGNLSVRLGDEMLITPTGGKSELAVPDDMVRTTLDGVVRGSGIPSSEWQMHAAAYRTADVGAVLHSHANACVAIATTRRPLPAFHYMVASFGGDDVPCVPYFAFGSRRLAEAAAAALQTRSACLLANHGMICTGRTLAAAVDAAGKLEMLARQYILAVQAGGPVLLTEAEIGEALRRYGYYGRTRIPEADAIAGPQPPPLGLQR
jgi:L-fuculose-phosphate aldolase